MSLPKIIHQIWFQGKILLPDKFKKNMQIIQDMNPLYNYILWDELKILELLHNNNNPEWTAKYYKFEHLHQKVDFAKFIILYTYGGIIIDMDAYTNQNLDQLFEENKDYDLVVSNIISIGVLESYTMCGKSNNCLNNGNFLGKKNSDIAKYMINNFGTECSAMDSKMNCIHKTTGPLIFNKLIEKYMSSEIILDKSKIKILDKEYLEPCLLDNCVLTENTYVIHKHENSWINAPMKKFSKIYIKNQNIFYCIFLILILLILWAILVIIQKFLRN